MFRILWTLVVLSLGAGGYHVGVFHVWPRLMAAQATERTVPVPTVSTAAAFEADDMLTVNVGEPGTQQWWNVFWYALRSDRPRGRAVLVPHEGGPNIHSLYLLAGGKGHRIIIRGLEIQSSQPPLEHLVVR
jgi:hypothetical protein